MLLAMKDASRLRHEFVTHGTAIVRNVISPQTLRELDVESMALIERFVRDGYRHADYWHFTKRATGRDVLYRIHNLHDQPAPAAIGLLSENGSLVSIAESMLGAPATWTAFAMIVKLPEVAAPVPWHRDRVDAAPGKALNLSVFLDASDASNGCLQVVPASHQLPDEADAPDIQRNGHVVDIEVAVGDIVAHDVRIAHGSRENTSSRMRRSLCVEFAVDRSRPRG